MRANGGARDGSPLDPCMNHLAFLYSSSLFLLLVRHMPTLSMLFMLPIFLHIMRQCFQGFVETVAIGCTGALDMTLPVCDRA